MSRTMGRWMVAGALALGSMGGQWWTTADAAPKPTGSPSPFAGSWRGTTPVTRSKWNITISDAGKVTGAAFDFTAAFARGSGGLASGGQRSMSGSVQEDGRLRVSGKDFDASGALASFQMTATLTKVDGNFGGTLEGVATDGQTFTWSPPGW